MSYLNGNTKGFVRLMQQIAANKEGQELDHRQVRCYARSMLVLVIDDYVELLLQAMSRPSLPHYDRSFLAERILKYVEKEGRQEEYDVDDIF